MKGLEEFDLERIDNSNSQAISYLRDKGAIIVNGIKGGVIDRLYGEAAILLNLPSEVKAQLQDDLDIPFEYTNAPEEERNPVSSSRELISGPVYAGFKPVRQETLSRYPKTNLLTCIDALDIAYREGLRIQRALGFGVEHGNPTLSVYKYPPTSDEFRVSEHDDVGYVLAFAPRGESLEILAKFNDKPEWVSPALRIDQALVLDKKIRHRVSNTPNKGRFSITMEI